MNLRALLELMRVSNLPTVWSNATVGGLAGTLAWLAFDAQTAPSFYTNFLINNPALVAVSVVIPSLILSLLYCSGMVLNDYWDRELDAKERPNRPIPSGRVSPKQARNLAVGLILAGVFFPAMNAVANLLNESSRSLTERFLWGIPPLVVTLLLVVCIMAYNRLHSGRPSSVLLMALCRLLAIVAAGTIWMPWPNSAFWWFFIAGPGLTVGAYTLAISIVARREVEPGGFGGPKVVMNMIAAMPLLDAAWLVAMGLWPASLVCVGCSVLTKLGHRKVAGS